MTDPQTDAGQQFARLVGRIQKAHAVPVEPLTPEEQQRSADNTKRLMTDLEQERANLTPAEQAIWHQRDREHQHYMIGQRWGELRFLAQIAAGVPLPEPEELIHEIDRRNERLDQRDREDGLRPADQQEETT